MPENTDVSVSTEFCDIQDWAKDNSMIIKLAKSKEIILYYPRAILIAIPSPILALKLLGVYIQENFSCEMHFKHIITVSSQRLHTLKTMKRKGLRLELLHCVFHAIILNKIMYAISAWYGVLNKSHVLQINSLVKRAFRYGYVKSVYKLEQFLQDYDDNLFTKAFRKSHAMRRQLPSPKSTCYNLRSLGHGLSVSLVKSELHKKSFINRVSFNKCC